MPAGGSADLTCATLQVTLDPNGSVANTFDRPEFDRYQLEEEVGAGGMSVVYAARDIELDRRVALKVMRRDVGETQDQARLRDEARALAGLNHANIVPVYDVGHARDGRLYMSLELVRGKNLRGWLDAAPRTPTEILDVLIAAGRGVAAAHAVGLVHCDFKPTNVLVGDDGRVRVVDFGIARRVMLSESITAHSLSGDVETPQSGRARPEVIGTPRYMSPEQVRAEPLDAQTDQFSFCLTLYEALYGQTAFLGASNRQRLRNILAGRIRPQPRGSLVPKRVHNVIVRGLAASAHDRWPSMNELLRALAKARDGSRRWGLIALAGIGVAGASALALIPAEDPCASTGREVDAVWTANRRDRIREAFQASKAPNAEEEHRRIDEQLSKFASDWSASRVRVCENKAVPAEQRALQRNCLQRDLEQYEVLVEVLSAADESTLRDANEAVSALPHTALCEVAGATSTEEVPEALRDRVEKLEEDLSTVPMLMRLHRYRRAEELTSRVLHEAELLGYAPLIATAQYRRADVMTSSGRQVDAANLFEKAYQTAETARMDRLAAEIAVDLLMIYGYRLARPKHAERWRKIARAAVERLGDEKDVVHAERTRTEGVIALRNSDYVRAKQLFEETVAAFDALERPQPLSKAEALSNLGIACLDLGLLDEAEDAFQSALRLVEREVGPYHTRFTSVINNLGSLAQARGDHQAAHDYFQRVYQAELTLYGPVDVRVAMSLNNMGTALSSLRRDKEAAALYRRSIAAYESGDYHGVDLARPVGNLAVAYMRDDDYEAAEANLLRAIQLIEEEAGPMQADLGVHWFNLASVRLDQRQYDRALEAMQRCLEIDENALGRQHPAVAQNLVAIASIYVNTDQPELARPLLEEALSIFAKFDLDPVLVGIAELALGKLLWDDGERVRARSLVDNAERVFVDAKEVAAPHLQGLRAWQKTVKY